MTDVQATGRVSDGERLRRWRMVLGATEEGDADTGQGRDGGKGVGVYAPTALYGLGGFHAFHAGGELFGLGVVTHWLTPGSAVTQTYSSP